MLVNNKQSNQDQERVDRTSLCVETIQWKLFEYVNTERGHFVT